MGQIRPYKYFSQQTKLLVQFFQQKLMNSRYLLFLSGMGVLCSGSEVVLSHPPHSFIPILLPESVEFCGFGNLSLIFVLFVCLKM